MSGLTRTLTSMWESPEDVWRRLNIWREEYLQRLMTTLIVGGDPPPWNTPRIPSSQGLTFLRMLDELAHGAADHDDLVSGSHPEKFVDEYLLPKLEETAPNGWPDWAVLWSDRLWVIELKTEAGSHRPAQLPYYLLLAAAAHPARRIDLTYITGPLQKPPPALSESQRFSHVQWSQVLPLVEAVWGNDPRPQVSSYVDAVRTVIENLLVLRPMEQRDAILNGVIRVPERVPVVEVSARSDDAGLVALAKATARDGQQRAVGAGSPEDLEMLRDAARTAIRFLPADDEARFVLPWMWKAESSTGPGLTPEGVEFGYELRFSRYDSVQVR